MAKSTFKDTTQAKCGSTNILTEYQLELQKLTFPAKSGQKKKSGKKKKGNTAFFFPDVTDSTAAGTGDNA